MKEHLFATRKEYTKFRQDYITNHVLNGKCVRCGRIATEPNVQLTLDHIIPEMLLARMGIDVERWWDEDNIQILCRMCNVQKGNQLDFTNPKTKELLLKYLAKI